MSFPSRSLVPALAALGLAVELPCPRAARAEEHSVSPGLLASLSFGDKTAFGLGLDLRYTTLFAGTFSSSCGPRRGGPGVFAQATWLNFSAGRFAAGLHGGGEMNDKLALDGEIGWTYRTSFDDAHQGGHGLHLGVASVVFPGVELALRGVIPWPGSRHEPEMTISLAGRFPGPFGMPVSPCQRVTGRPLRAGGEQVLAPVFALGPAGSAPGGATGGIDAVARAALARAWAEDAQAEGASIPAFLALARDLGATGAPATLARGALAAARDEVAHTALCCALAGEHAGAPIVAAILAPPPPAREARAEALTRLAIESWLDGCLGEGAAAARARRAAAGATDARAREALATIARDEARHAELGWQVLAYCLDAGGGAVREAVAERVEADAAPGEATTEGERDPAAWRAHGREDEAGAAWDETWTRARGRVQRLLVGAG